MNGLPARLALACVVPTVVILISFMILKTKKKKLTENGETTNVSKQNFGDADKLESINTCKEVNAENITPSKNKTPFDETMEERPHLYEFEETITQEEGRCINSRSSSSSTYQDSNDRAKVEKLADGNDSVCENEQIINEVIESCVASQKAKEVLFVAVDKCEGKDNCDATQLMSDICSFSEHSVSDPKIKSQTEVTESLHKNSHLHEGIEELHQGASYDLISLNKSFTGEADRDEKESKSVNCKDTNESNLTSDGLRESLPESTCIDVSTIKTSNTDVDTKFKVTINSDCDFEIDDRDAAYSPPYSNCSDALSEGSSDSGKGSSDVNTPASSTPNFPNLPDCIVFEFELPQHLCGVLIGKRGFHVNMIKEKTGAFISVQTHQFDPTLSLCAVIGTKDEVEKALHLVRKKFPLDKYPSITLEQVNTMAQATATVIPQAAQLHLPEGVMCEVIVVGIVSAGHVFLQQPTHPTYPSLSRLDGSMQACYAHTDTPEMPRPVEGGHICVAPLSGGWYRAQVSTVYPETDECDVKFVDHGLYSHLPISALRQIRSDFMSLPFQAEECYLAHVAPVNDDLSWSPEAQVCVETLAKGQILEAQIISYAEDGIPMVDLYRIQGPSYILINRELTERGLARWVEG